MLHICYFYLWTRTTTWRRGKGKTVTESKVDEVVRRDTAVVEWGAGKREGELLGRIQKI